MSYGGRTEVLVRIPRLLLRRALCHGGKRFCLLVGLYESKSKVEVEQWWFFSYTSTVETEYISMHPLELVISRIGPPNP